MPLIGLWLGGVMSYELWVMSYELWVRNYELGVMNYELGVMSYELWVMSYELGVRSYELWVVNRTVNEILVRIVIWGANLTQKLPLK